MLNGKLSNLSLYFITDKALSKKGNLSDVKAAITGGIKLVQYRNKELGDEAFKKEALQLQQLCKEGKVIFIINDRVEIAKEIDADGVHIGMGDLSLTEARKILGGKIIGVTVHNAEEAVEAEQNGADYLGVSPIFETRTKLDAGKAAGIKLIQDVKEKVHIPLVAIGGINLGNLPQVLEAGCPNVAMISAVVTKDNVADEVRKINEFIPAWV